MNVAFRANGLATAPIVVEGWEVVAAEGTFVIRLAIFVVARTAAMQAETKLAKPSALSSASATMPRVA